MTLLTCYCRFLLFVCFVFVFYIIMKYLLSIIDYKINFIFHMIVLTGYDADD